MTRIVSRLRKDYLKRLYLKYIDNKLIDNLKKYYYESKKKRLQIKVQNRSSTILPCCRGLNVYIYNGKRYIPFYVTKEVFGHKFGEFIYTRRFIGHKKHGKKLIFKKKNI